MGAEFYINTNKKKTMKGKGTDKFVYRKLEDILGTDRDVKAKTWNSRRIMLADDGMGFSFHDTIIHGGTETLIWYQNHLESVYCIEGEGEIEVCPEGVEKGKGTVFPIAPGTFYGLAGHERHFLRAKEGKPMRMMCTFSPALTGKEVHNEDGVYPAADSKVTDS